MLNERENELYNYLTTEFTPMMERESVETSRIYWVESVVIDIPEAGRNFPDGLPDHIKEFYFEHLEGRQYKVTKQLLKK